MAELIEVRTYDGSGNNLLNPDWGAAGIELLRKAPAEYPEYPDDTGSMMIGDERANPRDISNGIVTYVDGTLANDRGMSSFVWQWGQFIDHDLDLTPASSSNGVAPIAVTHADDPLSPGPLPFERSDYDDSTGVRQQINEIAAFIDGSMIYGSDGETADSLRTGTAGQLITSSGNLLALDSEGMFLSGDERVNEQVGLTAMHTLFTREHNRLAADIAITAGLTEDEEIYQTARKIVGAELQIITYEEFLPALLGTMAPDLATFERCPPWKRAARGG